MACHVRFCSTPALDDDLGWHKPLPPVQFKRFVIVEWDLIS